MKYSALFMLSYFFFDFDEFLEASSLAASLALAKNPFFFFSGKQSSAFSQSCHDIFYTPFKQSVGRRKNFFFRPRRHTRENLQFGFIRRYVRNFRKHLSFKRYRGSGIEYYGNFISGTDINKFIDDIRA